MKTEDLIGQLAGEPVADRRGIEGRAVTGLGIGFLIALALFLPVLGPRPDLMEAVQRPIVAVKMILPLLLGPVALLLALRSARPTTPAPAGVKALWLWPAVALALFLYAFATTAPGARAVAFLGHSIPICLPAIVVLSAPILIGLFRALKDGAPTRPARCGALAGLAAAGFATALYSTFCNEDSPLFYAVWYALGITIVTAAGAVAVGRYLRW